MPRLSDAALLFLFVVRVFSASLADYPQHDVDSGKVLDALSKQAFNNAMARLEQTGTPECNVTNVKIYREWREIPAEKRVAYTDAIQCLMHKPGKMPLFEGSRTAFDDFAVLHVLISPYVHMSGWFLLFHRYLLQAYGEALVECGYHGPLPYWEWGLDCDDLEASPVFDGSATSLGSNGAFIPNRTEHAINVPLMDGIPVGIGGGCVHSGPFSNYTVNIGSLLRPDATGYNPRCLTRDLNPYICQRWNSLRRTTQVLLEPSDVEVFRAMVEGDPRYPEGAEVRLGVHGGGHSMIGGDPGGDPLFSPLEPAFYLHHAQIDRLYFIWQNLDWDNRQYPEMSNQRDTKQNVAGTRSWLSVILTQNVTLNDTIPFQPLNVRRTLGELVDTISSTPLCYLYQ